MKPLTGDTLGPYRILEQIGRGGMATVFKAYQPALDRYVAVKVLPPHLAEERGFTQRFRREARAVAQLEHPHILAVYDSGQEGDLSYLVMRFVEAGTLKAQMGHPLDLERVTDLISQISEALDYAHEKGIIHRDIKPSNILMDRGDWALLTDFGLAKMMEGTQQITETGVGLGTPDYMSPEQGLGERVDRRSDIYSLGVVLYEMLTGRVPYKADTPMAVVLKHIHDPLPLPREVNPQIPEAIERVVLKAMAKDPGDRFKRARDLAGALREATRGIEVSGVGLTGTPVPLSSEATDKDVQTSRFPQGARNLVWILPITLAIVALGFVFTRIPLRVQIVGGRLEIISSEQIAQPLAPTDELTSVPTVELTDRASGDGVDGETPMIAATYAHDASLYDDFEGQGGLDDTKWAISSRSSAECLIEQSKGVVAFSNQSSDDTLVCILNLVERGPLSFENLGFIEAELYAVGDDAGRPGNQMIGLFTPDIEGGQWFAQCGIQWVDDGQYSTFSNVANFGRDQDSERYRSLSASPQTWYRMRLDVDPAAGEFSCYVDDELIDKYIPKDIEQLRDVLFNPSLTNFREPGGTGTYWADNVRISEPPTGRGQAASGITDSALVTVFNEDFEDGEMQAFTQMSGIWRVVDDGSGANRVLETKDGTGNKWSHIEFGPAGFSDGAIEYRVKIIDYDAARQDSGKTSLQFRATRWGDSNYSVDLSPFFRNLTLAYQGPYLSNQWDGLGDMLMEVERDRWYLIRVEIQGSQMSVYLDGVRVIVTNDSRLKPAGRFAFNVDIDAHVQFDDIRISSLGQERSANGNESSSPDGDKSSGLALFEDFEDGVANGIIIGEGDWEVVDDGTGNGVFLIDNTDSPSWPAVKIDISDFSDGAIEFRVKFLHYDLARDDGSGITTLHFRSSTQGGYVYALHPYWRRTQISFVGPDYIWEPLNGGIATTNFELNRWYSARIEVEGETIAAYLDGVLMSRVEDTRASIGDVTIGVGPNTVAQFDDIRITSAGLSVYEADN